MTQQLQRIANSSSRKSSRRYPTFTQNFLNCNSVLDRTNSPHMNAHSKVQIQIQAARSSEFRTDQTQVNSNHSVPGRNNCRPNSCNRYSEQRQARLQFLATQQGAIQIITTCTDDANLQISDWFLFSKLTHLLRCDIKQAHGCLG